MAAFVASTNGPSQPAGSTDADLDGDDDCDLSDSAIFVANFTGSW